MADSEAIKNKLPLEVDDTWSERVNLESNEYITEWRLITTVQPRKWVFQQVNGLGKKADGSNPGVDGITTISYTFTEPGDGGCVFERTLSCELPKGVDCPDGLLTVMARPGGIDRYHESIRKELDRKAGKF